MTLKGVLLVYYAAIFKRGKVGSDACLCEKLSNIIHSKTNPEQSINFYGNFHASCLDFVQLFHE